MAQKKFYAVRSGRQPGVYLTWDECKQQVDGYTNAEYKGFSTRHEADAYLGGTTSPKDATPKAVKTPQNLTAPTSTPAAAKGLRQVVIYSDGACTGNPGPGGYGVVIFSEGTRTELSAGYRRTTNNRMEMLGCIVGLQTLEERCYVTIYSDSRYVVNAIEQKWAVRWRKNNWQRRDENGQMKPALNADLWAKMLDLCDQHMVRFEWVRGHAGNEENERCDQLARAATVSGNLAIDSFYENPTRNRE
jgi:ribonuclease HI